MNSVGIDFGSTFSLAGCLTSAGVPTLIPDQHGNTDFRTPSLGYVSAEGALVGTHVEMLLDAEPNAKIVRFPKLALGLDEPIYTDEVGRQWSAEAICGLILRKLRRDAETYSNRAVTSVTLAVPSQFDELCRRRLKDACAIAGLPTPYLVEEAVAAAAYYGYSSPNESTTLLVYDFGGGTFDTTLLRLEPGKIEVLSCDGCRNVGGKRIDEELMQKIALDVKMLYGLDLLSNPAWEVQVRRFSESAKIALSEENRVFLTRDTFLGGRPYRFVLTRRQFDEMIQSYVDETLAACERCIAAAKSTWIDVDRILVTGGSSQIPLAKSAIRKRSQKPDHCFHCSQPQLAVVYGAALIAAQREGSAPNHMPSVFQHISTSDLGLRVWDHQSGKPGVSVLIRRNSRLPASHKMTFYTRRADQDRIVFELVQSKGEQDTPTSLGHFSFGPIPNVRKNYPVELQISCDAEGVVTAMVRDPATKQELKRIIEDASQIDSVRLGKACERVATIRLNE